MTVQEYLDQLADRILSDAIDGTMPEAIKREMQYLLDRLQTEMDIFGHVQTKFPPAILDMPWEQFHGKISQLELLMRQH